MKKSEEILQNNRLIVELEVPDQIENIKLGMVVFPEPKDGQNTHDISSLRYHESWDWLMPLIKHLRSTKEFNSVTIIPKQFGDNEMVRGLYTQDIDLALKGVVKYVKWHNSQLDKKTNKK